MAVTEPRPPRRGSRPRTPPTARIAFGRIRAPETREPIGTEIGRALRQGTSVERYNRAWYMGPVTESTTDGVRTFQGRIGFQRTTGNTELWDEDRKDFGLKAVLEGATSPFAINSGTLVVAFQLRGSTIKRTSFTGALTALMNESSSYDGWAVEPVLPEATLTQWAEAVDTIVKVRAVVKVPNPRYEHEDVQNLLEKTRADLARVELHGENLQLTEYDFLRHMIEHTARNEEYGYVVAEGRSRGRRTSFDSREDAAPTESVATVDPTTREVPSDALRQAVLDPPPSAVDPPAETSEAEEPPVGQEGDQ